MSGEAAAAAEGSESSREAAVPSPWSTTTGKGEAIAPAGVSSMGLVGNGEEWRFWWGFLGFLSTRGEPLCFVFRFRGIIFVVLRTRLVSF
jgi:hypothetical protein